MTTWWIAGTLSLSVALASLLAGCRKPTDMTVEPCGLGIIALHSAIYCVTVSVSPEGPPDESQTSPHLQSSPPQRRPPAGPTGGTQLTNHP